jgi:hypothetical protein
MFYHPRSCASCAPFSSDLTMKFCLQMHNTCPTHLIFTDLLHRQNFMKNKIYGLYHRIIFIYLLCFPGASSWTVGLVASNGLGSIVATQTRWYSDYTTRLTTKELCFGSRQVHEIFMFSNIRGFNKSLLYGDYFVWYKSTEV